MSEYQDTTGK